jgi:serine/threonine protein kinase
MEQLDAPGPGPAKQLTLLPKWSECLVHALEYIHNQRVRHKDVKPANVLVKGDQIFITDFGIAKDFLDEINSGSNNTHGLHTKAYSAPEVMTEHARRGRKADIFSLGCVFLEMVTVFLHESLQEFISLRESKGPNLSPYYASLDKVLQWTEHLLEVFDRRDNRMSISRKWVLLPLLMLRYDASDRPTSREMVQQLAKIPYGDIQRCASCNNSVTAKMIHCTEYDALQDGDSSTAKDIFVGYDGSSGVVSDSSKHYFLVPYARNPNFIGRESQLSELRVMTDLQFQHSRMAVTGLGGVGKTQTALELAYRKQGQCSVFWVQASNLSRLEQSYLGIGQMLGIPVIEKVC